LLLIIKSSHDHYQTDKSDNVEVDDEVENDYNEVCCWRGSCKAASISLLAICCWK